MMERENPLAELEAIYLDGDWDRAFKRAVGARGTLDLLRIALMIAADLRTIRAAVEGRGTPGNFPPDAQLVGKGRGGK